MKKKLLALLLAMVMVFSIVPTAAFADEGTARPAPPRTVYFSVSNDANYLVDTNGEAIVLRELTVPYFDLGIYGLNGFYFNSDNFGSYGPDPSFPGEDPNHPNPPKSQLTPGTSQYAYGLVTMLHVFIYATEVLYLGIAPENAGQGALNSYSNVLDIDGSVGSMFITNFWGLDFNLNYYKNYAYPLASEGWGATADQILVYDGDVVTVGHFNYRDFFSDDNAIFNFASFNGGKAALTTATRGQNVQLTMTSCGADMWSSDCLTVYQSYGAGVPVYVGRVGSGLNGNAEYWNVMSATTDANGNISIDTTNLTSGRYAVSVCGQQGPTSSNISSAPGGILIDVRVIVGDINADGVVNSTDVDIVTEVAMELRTLSAAEFEAADVNHNGYIDFDDVDAISALAGID